MNGTPIDVSIVILTKNGGSIFREVVQSILVQQSNLLTELVVVDSGSNDGTLEYLQSVKCRLYRIPESVFEFGQTRDFAFEKARGNIIVSLSQDAVPYGKSWLSTLVHLIIDGADVVQGLIRCPKNRSYFYWENDGLFWYTREGRSFFDIVGPIGLSCVHMAVRRSVWKECRFGSVLFCEDKVFQWKLWQKGVSIVVSEAIVEHAHDYNLVSLLKRCYFEGYGWSYVPTKYKFLDTMRDMMQANVWSTWLKALLSGDLKSYSELLFPIIRPIGLYTGFRKGTFDRRKVKAETDSNNKNVTCPHSLYHL